LGSRAKVEFVFRKDERWTKNCHNKTYNKISIHDQVELI
jgi:hypothetical protein